MLLNQSIDLKTLLTDLHDEKAEIISGGRCTDKHDGLDSMYAAEMDRDYYAPPETRE